MRTFFLAVLLLAAVPVFAQLPSNTLTISATRNIVLQPDQLVFGLTVSSNKTTTLEQIVAALSGLGLTAANLTGVDNSTATTLQWNFTLAVPIATVTTAINSLVNLQQSIGQNNSGLTLAFFGNGTQVSQKSQQSVSCSNTDLISDAQAQAQKLAAAAGMTLGPVTKLSNTPASGTAQVAASFLSGVISVASYSDFLIGTPSSPLTCTLVVQFQLLP